MSERAEVSSNEDVVITPLFDGESITEAELKGEESEVTQEGSQAY